MTTPAIPAGFFLQNRQRLRETLRSSSRHGLIVIAAHSSVQASGDTTHFPFQQDRHFFYLTGIQHPDCILVMDLAQNHEWLILPQASRYETIFNGTPDAEWLRRTSGIDEVLSRLAGMRQLRKLLVSSLRTYTLYPDRLHTSRVSHNHARKRLLALLKRNGAHRVEFIDDHINRMRAIKQAEEIIQLQHAVTVTASAFSAMRSMLRQGLAEYELEAAMTYQIRKRGLHHAYEPIIAGGSNALTLHYTKNVDRVKRGSLVLVDVGAMSNCYAADITRTVAISAAVLPRQRELFDFVRDVQAHCLQLIRPGVGLRDYHRAALAYYQENLSRIGLDAHHVHRFLPHAISHGLGLDVHDSLAFDSFAVGMVLTVEPGVYIQEEGIGIRIEDNIIVTDSGVNVLSRMIPNELFLKK